MELAYYNPSELCNSLVIKYEHVWAGDENISIIDRHLPSGYASLVFNSSGKASIHEEQIIHLPQLFLVVPLFRAVNIGIYENLDSFIITCNASILSKLLSLQLASSKNNYYRNIENKELEAVKHEFINNSSAIERIKIIEQFFLDKGLSNYQADEIDELYKQIILGQGGISISKYIEQYDKSPRYFREHFTDRVGLNAKTLARIVRVNNLWSLIINNNAVDFQDMVFEGDYFDQAHLVHDFKNIVGETPSYFFKRNLDNVKIISGKR